jgi:hypothetical protein
LDQKRTADRAAQTLSLSLMTAFPNHRQSPFIDLRTKSVPSHRDVLATDRLSLQYDVPALKTLALDHIRGQLAKCDIVEEAFSRFASR